MDTDEKRDAFDVKSHEEILLLLKELDAIEKRVKYLPLSGETIENADTIAKTIEITEIPVETIQEPQPDRPIDVIHRKTLKQHHHPSLLDLYKKQRSAEKKSKPRSFSHEGDQLSTVTPVEPEVSRPAKRRKQKEKPINSTFRLYITEDGTLAGLDFKKQKPPKTQRTEIGDQAQDIPEPGFKGKLKHVVKKIIPRASKKREAGTGIVNRIKGIVKRKPK